MNGLDLKTVIPAAAAILGALGYGGIQAQQVDSLEIIMAGYEEAARQADERSEFCESLLTNRAGIVLTQEVP